MNYILFDDNARIDLLPLTFTRPIADIRIGIRTIREKWEDLLDSKTSSITEDYLTKKFPAVYTDTNILINGSICPTQALVKEVMNLKNGEALKCDNYIVAICGDKSIKNIDLKDDTTPDGFSFIETTETHLKIRFPWNIFANNGDELINDFELLTKGRKSEKLSDTNKILGEGAIFIEKGAVVECAIINTTNGPVYIGKDSEVMEGSIIRGPFALCEYSVLKMAAKIYGPTTIGPWSKVGGELNNVVITGYTNKAHDGFLGNAVLGEWCNLGADTNNSNLKNTYDEVKMWNYREQRFIKTGMQFCGLVMGDHSKSAINTMFNTGTVVGMSSNVFGAGFNRNYIQSFSWGGPSGMKDYNFKKSIEVARNVYKRRDIEFTEIDEAIFSHVYKLTYDK